MATTVSKERFVRLEPFLNERQRRLAAAAEAQRLGRGGILAVAGWRSICAGPAAGSGAGLPELPRGDSFVAKGLL